MAYFPASSIQTCVYN